MDKNGTGMLYLCATPIGNLGDVTKRLAETLRNCDIIAAEDTRHTLRLLNHLNISTPLISYHEHNKYKKGNELVSLMMEGKTLALVTDAGTPGISDPGEDLVRLCIDAKIKVTAIPGPCALVLALILSGLPTRRFVFEGFLPVDKKERSGVLEDIKSQHRTVILYESPHSLLKTLYDIKKYIYSDDNNMTFQNLRTDESTENYARRISIIKEITKIYEDVKTLTIDEHIDYFEKNNPRGEYVIIIEGKSVMQIKTENRRKWDSLNINEHIEHYIDSGYDEKEAMKLVSRDRGVSKRDIYKEYKIESGSKESLNNI